MIDARDFLDSVAGYANQDVGGPKSAADRPIRLGTIEPFYTSGLARVLFDGESVISKKGYSWANTYGTPVAGDRVFLIPVGQSYIIGGTIKSTVSYPKYHPLTLDPFWSVYDSVNYYAPSFTKTAGGMVKLAGLVSKPSNPLSYYSAGPNGWPIATLPEGFRPSTALRFPIMTRSSVGSINIDIDGRVSAIGTWGEWFSLSNVHFPTETLTWTTAAYLNGNTQFSTYPAPNYAMDPFKRIWVRGAAAKTGTSNATDTPIFNIGAAGFQPQKAPHIVTTSNGTTSQLSEFSQISMKTNGDVLYKPGVMNDDEMYYDGIMYHPASVTDWTEITSIGGGWVNLDAASFNTLAYRKDADGVVHLKGMVRSGTIGQVFFNLPAGFRPIKDIIFATTSADAAARVDIGKDGNVVGLQGSNAWFSLDGLSFTPEQ